MSKTAAVFTRVDPLVKAQAEEILNKLGISMSTAMGIFLQQVVIQKGLPFEVKLPQDKPISLDDLSEEELNKLMKQAIDSVNNKKCTSLEEFEQSIKKEYNI